MTATATLRVAPRRDEDLTVTLPLRDAALCLEEGCATIFRLAAGRCPACSSNAWMLLSRWLERSVTT